MGVQNKPIDIVIAEKNPLLQSSLVKLFAGDERFCLAAVTADGEKFLEAADRVRFDVGIIGWEMPGVDGRAVLQALRNRADAPRLIVYTGSPNPDVPRQAMTLGAAGFCSKREPPEQLLDTIQAVAAGRMVFPFIDVSSLASDPLAGLTPRERELLASLAGGLTNQQMASQLDISLNTVKFHLKNLYDKLGVGNRAQAVAFFLKGRESR
ncbi:MAG: response regulator transcription factor [Rhodospirillaceae bacterium]|nr:response regulator transcription factor [Rhodospirillales bacterium]